MRTGLACDLCELGTDLTWVIRTNHFTVVVGDEPHHYADDEEWGLCSRCKHDVLADTQQPILARRREALKRDFDLAWNALSPTDQDFVLQTTDMVVLAALSCRQKRYGRAWTQEDARLGRQQIEEDGGRGLRR